MAEGVAPDVAGPLIAAAADGLLSAVLARRAKADAEDADPADPGDE